MLGFEENENEFLLKWILKSFLKWYLKETNQKYFSDLNRFQCQSISFLWYEKLVFYNQNEIQH
jgi:hypothetical protein